MVFMIALMRGEMDIIIGMRLLNTDTGQVINAPKNKVIMAMISGDIIIENLDITEDGKLKAIGGNLSKYASYYNYETSKFKESLVLISKDSNGTFNCIDSKGTMFKLTLRQILKGGLNVANADVVGTQLILANNTAETMQLTTEELNIRNMIKQYKAKCKIAGAVVPRIVIEGNEIVLKEIVTNFENYQVPNFITKIGNVAEVNSWVTRCKDTKTITVQNNVRYIGEGTFSNMAAEVIDISKAQINSMQRNLFARCESLKIVLLPNTITNIGNSAFIDCISLTDIVIPSSIKHIEDYAFNGCSSLKNIEIPKSVTRIGDWSISRCFKLQKLTIPDNVKYIGEGAFGYCESLTELYIPDSVNVIRDKAFVGCSSLKKIRISPNVTHINTNVFDNTQLEQIEIPEQLEKYLRRFKGKLKILGK